MQLMRAICRRGVAGVVVTHNAQMASCADRVVVLQDGQVIDQTQASPGPDSLLTPARSDERDAARPPGSSRLRQRRHRWAAGRDPVGQAAAAPGVAAADPGAGPAGPDRRGGGLRRGRRLQRGVPAESAVRLRQLPPAVRRGRPEDHDGGHHGSQEGVRHHSGDWPPVRVHPRLDPDRRVPGPEPGRPLQRPDARPGAGALPLRRRAGRRHQRGSAELFRSTSAPCYPCPDTTRG